MITEKTFYKYVKCPTWVYFDAHAKEKPHDPLMDALIQDKLLPAHEREVLNGREDIAEVTEEDPEAAYRQTLEFMKAGRQTIYRGVLVHKHYVGHPDVLERVEGRSKLGDYYYVAADIKRVFDLRAEYKFQGCFYAELLERVQGTRPVKGYVITSDGTVFDYLIDEFEAEYHLTLDAIERIMAGQEPAHFTTSGCKQSPWFEECRGISESCNDLSMLNRVWREEVKSLERAGVRTIDALARLSVPELHRLVPEMDSVRVARLRDKAAAIKENRHVVLRPIEFPEAEVELFFDIESDPLRDFDYLFGMLIVCDGEPEYRSFFANTPENAERMWLEFTAFLERHAESPIYHYGDFEHHVVERYARRFGLSNRLREALASNMIDLQVMARDHMIFPLTFYSLKDIGGYIGCEWRTKDSSGADSVMWFEKWLETQDDATLQKIVEYNEDDVRATWKLQRWLRENAT